MATTRTRVRSEDVIFQGIVFRRYPDSRCWSDQVYYRPHVGDHRRASKACTARCGKPITDRFPPAGRCIIKMAIR